MNIQHSLNQSMQAAAQITSGSRGNSVSRLRSTMFVYRMANHLRVAHANQAGVAVFSRSAPWHRTMFGVNEFLFDISVLECDTTQSVRRLTSSPYVKRAIWLVESEFQRDSRAILHDISKLKIGQGEKKLFVASQFNDMPGELDILAQAATGIDGILYLALLPSPLHWQAGKNVIYSFKFTGASWSSNSLAAC